MKIVSTIVLSLASFCIRAQGDIPTGYKKGMIVMEDSTMLSGYIREHIRSDASLVFIDEKKEKKQHLDGSQIRSVLIESTRFICIRGDFFRVISEGELYFLQKASDASGKPIYNGSEALLVNGTEGSPGDYFVYKPAERLLYLVTRKTLERVIAETFAGCTAAVDNAKAVQGDLSSLKNAVDLYNNRSK
jgi:hypothetical protein